MNDQENELEKFRSEWRKEVQEKRQEHKKEKEQFSRRLSAAETSLSDIVDKTELLTLEKEPVTAMDHYVLAVDNEREGKLGKALDSYRRAFKLDPDIDFAYKKHYQTNILPTLNEPIKEEKTFKHIVPLGKEYVPPAVTQETLSTLIQGFLEQDTTYIPRVDYKPVAIAKLPSEIMLYILRYLSLHNVSAFAQFALTCKKFFLYSRESSVWQYACVHVFRLPDMTLEESRAHQAKKVLGYNGWLHMFIDRPRIRYDGVYISTCHYIRQGVSETGWNKPVHFVTYYRYLRFFPDGTVLKHVNTDEPSLVVRSLNPGFHKQQVFFGRFLVEDSVVIEMKDPMLPTETFHMTLGLKQTHRGKHNKLIWEEYLSVPSVPDRAHHVHDLKLLKPYFFSPVRSYKVDYSDNQEDL